MAEVKYEGPLAPNENGRILWPENLAELDELSQGTLFPALAQRMARTEADRERERAESKEYDARWQHLRDKRAELTEKHPDQWVGIGGDWKLQVADSHDALLEKIKAHGAWPPQPVTMFLNTKQRRLIL